MKKFQIYCNGILLIRDIDTSDEALRLMKELKSNKRLKKSNYQMEFRKITGDKIHRTIITKTLKSE